MKSAKDLQDSIAESRCAIKAAVDIATDEDRELTEDEQTLVDGHLQDIERLESQLEARQKIDAQTKVLAAQQLEPVIDSQVNAVNSDPMARISVPARAKFHGSLKAFQGENAEKEAFIAGHLFLAGVRKSERSLEWCRNNGFSDIVGTMSTSDNGLGGFITTDEMQRSLIRLREERGVFPRFANNIPMGADLMRIPRLLADVTAYWTGEGDEITASDPTLGSAEMMARKVAALTKVPTELDEDAVVQVGEMITTSMAYAMADKIDEAAFNGDGTSTYGGNVGLKNALNSSAVQDAASGNDSALTLDLADFEATVGLYPQYPGAMPRWFVHSAVYWASMARLMDAGGGNRVQDLGSGPVMQFLGYPVEFTQVLPSTTGTLASTIICYFGDLRLGASYGTRRSARADVSVDRYFENDLIGIRMTERVGILIHERGDTIRTRPIVALKTAA